MYAFLHHPTSCQSETLNTGDGLLKIIDARGNHVSIATADPGLAAALDAAFWDWHRAQEATADMREAV